MDSFNKYALEVFIQQNAILHGDFTLASGAVSGVYFDKYQLMAPLVFEACLDQLENLVDMERFSVVAGMELGGALLAHGLALRHKKAYLAVRKKASTHGPGHSVEGFLPDLESNRVLLIEDVVTTGGSVIEAIQKLEAVETEAGKWQIIGTQDYALKVGRVVALITRDLDEHIPEFLMTLGVANISFGTVFQMSELL